MTKPATIICPLCNDTVEKLLYRYHIENERQVIKRIREQNPAWSEQNGACSRCVDYYHTEMVMKQRMLPEIGPHFPVKSADDFIILPTGLRLNADPRFTGKGVTICFIDSGFYAHPDLAAFKNRIKAFVDIPNNKVLNIPPLEQFGEAWHGTMTSVVCAGDGYLSNGLYKGIACNAQLVLLKVSEVLPTGNGSVAGYRITNENIIKALQWVLQHHREFAIRIVNISLGAEDSRAYMQSEIDRLAEKLIDEGVVIVAAIGNDENGIVKAPANAPNAIAVGGIDDGNKLDEPVTSLYHSTFGKTADDFMKPELVAPAIWIAAPILPGTKEQKEAESLHWVLQTGGLCTGLENLFPCTRIDESILRSGDAALIKESVRRRMQTCKYISPHYMHVEGTSFAAPIVSSIVAQMLEIDTTMTPAIVRNILFSTAKRLKNYPAERQGFGMVQPRKSVLKMLNKPNLVKPGPSPLVNKRKNTIGFYVQYDCASQVSLAGSFNHWQQDVLLLEPGINGSWEIDIPMPAPGRYQYKFFINESLWIEDINNPYREPDGFGGFNSIFMIEN